MRANSIIPIPCSGHDVRNNGQYLNAVPRTQCDVLNGAKALIKTSAIADPGDSFSLTYTHSS